MCEMGATADDVPATERVCKHAVDIESLDARGILAALGASDKELYASESTCAQPALSHPKILNDVGECADVVSELLRRSLEDAKATIAAREPAAADGGVKPSDADGEIRPATMAENDANSTGDETRLDEFDFDRFASKEGAARATEEAPTTADPRPRTDPPEGGRRADDDANDDDDAMELLDAMLKEEDGEDGEDVTLPPAPDVPPTAAVFVVGCGYAGRVAFLAATHANHVAVMRGFQPIFHPILPGGTSQLCDVGAPETAEDDHRAAIDDFDAALARAGGDTIVDAAIVGVAHGFRERYVASAVDRAMRDPKRRFSVFLVGYCAGKHASDEGPGSVARAAVEGGATGEPGGPPPGTPHGAPPTFRDVVWRLEPDLGGLLTEHPWNISPFKDGYGPIDAAEGKWERRMPMRVRKRKIINPVVGAECVHACDALKCGTATKIILDAAFSTGEFIFIFVWANILTWFFLTGILMAEDDEREREWENVDPKDADADPDADPANLVERPGPYPIAWEASECALEMVATYLMSASGVTQHFYRSALGKSKSTSTSTSKSKKEDALTEEGDEREEDEAKSSFDAGVVSVVERAASAVASGGSVHFVGHGGVGAMALIAVPDAITAFGAAQRDFHAHLGTKGGWGALDPAFDDEHGGGSPRPPPGGAREISRERFVDATLPKLRANDLVVQLAAGHTPCAVVMTNDLTYHDVAERFPSAGIAAVRWPEVAEAAKARGVGVAVVVAPGYECAQLCPPAPERSVLRAVWCARLAEVHVKHAIDAIVAGCGVLLGRTSHGGMPICSLVQNERTLARATRVVAVAAGCGEDRAKMAVVRSVLGDEFDPRPGGDRVPRAEVLCKRARAAAAAEGAGVVPVAVLLAGEVCATAAEAREAVTEAASDGGGCGTGGGVRGVLSRYSR